MDENADEPAFGHGPLEIRIAGVLSNLGVLRTVVSAHAAGAGFDPDAVADLKLAVDEACTALIIRMDPPGAPLTVTLNRLADELAIEIATPATVVDDPLAGFTGHVLNILADDVKAYHVAAEGQSPVSGLSMTVRPSAAG